MSPVPWTLIPFDQSITSISSQVMPHLPSQRTKVSSASLTPGLYDALTFFRVIDVAKAIVRRFTDAMANHDHNGQGYQLTTFSSHADHIGVINHWNFDAMWKKVQFGEGTRVMTGWQKVKELH